ncbi:MAG: LON peptidase substrate-binding domain-containing protein [Oligoflexales bacterium]
MTSFSVPFMNLRGSVLFPGMVLTITVGRQETIRAVKHAVDQGEGNLAVFTQRHVEDNGPIVAHEMFEYGVLCNATNSVFMPDGSALVHLEALHVIRREEVQEKGAVQMALVKDISTSGADDVWQSASEIAAPSLNFDLTRFLGSLFRNEETGIDALKLKLLNDAVSKRQAILEASGSKERRLALETVLEAAKLPI